MANPSPHTATQTASERLTAARAVKDDAIVRELCWAAIGSRLWPSFITAPSKPQKSFPWLLCIDSPAGRLVYRLSEEEREMFTHLEERENDGVPCSGGDKQARLLHLALEGW